MAEQRSPLEIGVTVEVMLEKPKCQCIIIDRPTGKSDAVIGFTITWTELVESIKEGRDPVKEAIEAATKD